MSFDSLLCLIPFAIAYLSFSIWLHERDARGKSDWVPLFVSVFSAAFGVGLLIYV